jgi:PIN domain nuclease of toxin-antitoxin system
LFAGLGRDGFGVLGIGIDDSADAGSLDWSHRDPFDRMLVAQAAAEKHTLLTSDRLLAGYGKFVRVV